MQENQLPDYGGSTTSLKYRYKESRIVIIPYLSLIQSFGIPLVIFQVKYRDMASDRNPCARGVHQVHLQ